MIRTEHTYLLYADSDTIGFAFFNDKKTHGFISAMYITHKRQRSGYGTYLLNFIEQAAKRKGLNCFVLKALKMFDWTIAFYKKNGFIIFDEIQTQKPDFIREYIPPAHWEVVMRKGSF